jgi:hypothetical protein
VSECSLVILCIKQERKILYNETSDKQLLSNFFLVVTGQHYTRNNMTRLSESERDRGLTIYFNNKNLNISRFTGFPFKYYRIELSNEIIGHNVCFAKGRRYI